MFWLDIYLLTELCTSSSDIHLEVGWKLASKFQTTYFKENCHIFLYCAFLFVLYLNSKTLWVNHVKLYKSLLWLQGISFNTGNQSLTSRVSSPAMTRLSSPAITRVSSPATTHLSSPAITCVSSPATTLVCHLMQLHTTRVSSPVRVGHPGCPAVSAGPAPCPRPWDGMSGYRHANPVVCGTRTFSF